MPSDPYRNRDICPRLKPQDYHILMRTLTNCLVYEKSDAAKFRLRVLNHLYQFGWRAASLGFNVPRSTLYDWKKQFESSRKRLISLVPKSTRPKHTRSMLVDSRLVEFIRNIREQYGAISKWKLKLFLDEYAKELGIPQVFSRLRTPTDNPALERFNWTVQDEWLSLSEVGLDELQDANDDLTQWLIQYNADRPHQSLGYQTPLAYAQQEFPVSLMWASSTAG